MGLPRVEKPVAPAADAAPPAPRRRWYRRIPRACWVCMAVAALNALVWNVITPAFQVPDEPVQVGYAQYLAETGKLPRPLSPYFNGSPEENDVMAGVGFSTLAKAEWSPLRSESLVRLLDEQHPARVNERAAGYIGSAPPLYFALEAIPYRLASSGNFFDRLFAMRALSALLAALTVGFVYLFLRELLPRRRLAWTVGALVVALQPVFGSIAGGVNYDNLLWTASAALMWLVAYGFRHGLTTKVAAGIGVALLVGILTKGTMYALIPGTLIALAAMVLRAHDRRRAAIAAGIAVGCLAVPFALWLAANQAIWHRSVVTSTAGGGAAAHSSLGGQLDYIWEFYLPRLPFMHHNWYSTYPTHPFWQSYFQGFVGRFGWFQYGFPTFADWIAVAVFGLLALLAVVELVRRRASLRRRWLEFASYLVMTLGVFVLVNAAGYRYRLQTGQPFEQTRYLFPLLPLYGAAVALAVLGTGRRYTAAFAAVVVLAAFGHDLFAQFLTIGRFYT